MADSWWRAFRRPSPVVPRRREHVEPPRREPVQARVESESVTDAGDALDRLAAAVFSGVEGRARVAPLLERFDAEVGALAPDEPDFDLMQIARMDWALCDVPATPDAALGDTWAWRAIHGRVPGLPVFDTHYPGSSVAAAARSVVGLFEIYPGEPTWVRDRLSGLVLRLSDSVGPFPVLEPERPAALWELRLVPDGGGGFFVAREPIDYPIELLDKLEQDFPKLFSRAPWPTLQDLRRARLRYLCAGKRTPIGRMPRVSVSGSQLSLRRLNQCGPSMHWLAQHQERIDVDPIDRHAQSHRRAGREADRRAATDRQSCVHERVRERRIDGLDPITVIEPQLELPIFTAPDIRDLAVRDRQHERVRLDIEGEPMRERELAGDIDVPPVVTHDVDILERPRGPRARTQGLDAVEGIAMHGHRCVAVLGAPGLGLGWRRLALACSVARGWFWRRSAAEQRQCQCE